MPTGIVMPTPGQQEAMAQNLYLSLYLNLVPVVAARQLAGSREDWNGETMPLPESIAAESEAIAKAAMKKLGIHVQ